MYLKTCESLYDGEVINPSVVKIVVAKEPKTPNCGSYLNDGKESFPTVWMLIKHVQSGYTFSTEAIHKGIDFEHHILLRTKSKEDVLPDIKSGDTFGYAGFIVPEDESLKPIKKFISITVKEYNPLTKYDCI